MSPRELVASYYDSLKRKDDRWKDLYADGAEFADASKTLYAQGKASIIQSFVTFLRGVTDVKVKQWVVEGDTVCAIVNYAYINPKGEQMNQDVAEVSRVEGNKITELVLYFDLTAYRSFMRG